MDRSAIIFKKCYFSYTHKKSNHKKAPVPRTILRVAQRLPEAMHHAAMCGSAPFARMLTIGRWLRA